MDKLYCLTFYSRPNEDYRDGFHIGLFSTREEAVAVELHYRREVTGFKDYPCESEITEVSVIGSCASTEVVYRYVGWNVNEDYDEVDIIESNCYLSKEQAQADYANAQQQTPRQEWALNRHVIGRCDWKEGFTRS